jgi:hypothetical protein
MHSPARERQGKLAMTPISWLCFSSVMLSMWFVALYVLGCSYYLFNFNWGAPYNGHVYPFFNGNPPLPLPKKPPDPGPLPHIEPMCHKVPSSDWSLDLFYPSGTDNAICDTFLQELDDDFFLFGSGSSLTTLSAFTSVTPMHDPTWSE